MKKWKNSFVVTDVIFEKKDNLKIKLENLLKIKSNEIIINEDYSNAYIDLIEIIEEKEKEFEICLIYRKHRFINYNNKIYYRYTSVWMYNYKKNYKRTNVCLTTGVRIRRISLLKRDNLYVR